jgi:hypothetical protein
MNMATNEIRMANPLSAVPAVHRVRAAGRWWYGNCAWNALGICAALDVDGRIESSCPDCGEQIALEVQNRGLMMSVCCSTARFPPGTLISFA